MNSSSLQRMRDEAEMLKLSSEWLTDQINELIFEAEDPYLTDYEVSKLLARVDKLLIRSEWESEQFNKFYKKYNKNEL